MFVVDSKHAPGRATIASPANFVVYVNVFSKVPTTASSISFNCLIAKVLNTNYNNQHQVPDRSAFLPYVNNNVDYA